jgi:hypothetical protein
MYLKGAIHRKLVQVLEAEMTAAARGREAGASVRAKKDAGAR